MKPPREPELEALQAVVECGTTASAAERLGRSAHTVNKLLFRLRQRLWARSQAQAAARAWWLALIR